MRRRLVILGVAVLLAALVLGYAVFALLATKRRVLDAAYAEGRSGK